MGTIELIYGVLLWSTVGLVLTGAVMGIFYVWDKIEEYLRTHSKYWRKD